MNNPASFSPASASADRYSGLRRVWMPGIEYAGETAAQASARERKWLAEDARAEADAARLRQWKITAMVGELTKSKFYPNESKISITNN